MSNRVSELFARVEPYLFQALVAVMLLVGGGFAYKHFAAKSLYVGGSQVVVFDVVKMANAQRRVASALMGRDPATMGEQATLLLDIQDSTREVIREVAGPGTLVLVKQAVIHTDVLDITDEVLVKLRLPVDVPTSDPSNTSINFAPTILDSTPPPTSLSERQRSRNPLGAGQVLP